MALTSGVIPDVRPLLFGGMTITSCCRVDKHMALRQSASKTTATIATTATRATRATRATATRNNKEQQGTTRNNHQPEPPTSTTTATTTTMAACVRHELRGHTSLQNNNNYYNNNTIWGGSVLTGEEPPPHSGELKHALTQAGGPTQCQLSRPMSSGHHISMEHRLRRKQLNSDTNASNKTYLKEIQEKRKEETFSLEKMNKENEKHEKSQNEEMNKK